MSVFGIMWLCFRSGLLNLLERGFLMVDDKPKILSCVFNDKVLCSYRKSEDFGIMDRCFSCRHHADFVRFMDEQDAEVMDEIDRIRREGYGR